MFKTKKYKAIIGLAAIVSCALGVRTYAIESLKTPTHTNEINKDKAAYLNSLTSDTKAIVDMKTKLLKNVNFSEISKTTSEFEDIAICFLFQRKNFIEKFEELINIFEYAIPPAPAIDLGKDKPYHDNNISYLMNIALQRIPGNPQDIQTKLKNFYSYIKDICELKLIDFEELNEELKYKFENLKKSNKNKLNFMSLLDTQSIREAGVDFSKIYKTITRAELAFPTFFNSNENTQSINKETTNYNDIYIYTLNHINALYEFFNELFNKLIEFYSNNTYIEKCHANIKNSDYVRLLQIIYSIHKSFMASSDKKMKNGKTIKNMFYKQIYDRMDVLKLYGRTQLIKNSAKNFVQNADNTIIPTLDGIVNNSPVDYFSSTNPSNLSNSNTNNKKLLSDLDHKAMKRYKKNSLKFAWDACSSLHSALTLMLKSHFGEQGAKKVYNLQGSNFDNIQHLISLIPYFLKLHQADTRVYHNLDICDLDICDLDICELDNDSSMANYVKELDSIKKQIPLLALFYIFIECCYYARETFKFSSRNFHDAFKKIREFILEMTNPNNDKSNDNSKLVNTLSKCLGAMKETILHIMVSSNIQLTPASMDFITYDDHYWFDRNKYSSEIVPTIQEDISSLANTTDSVSSDFISTARALMHLKEYFFKEDKYRKD